VGDAWVLETVAQLGMERTVRSECRRKSRVVMEKVRKYLGGPRLAVCNLFEGTNPRRLFAKIALGGKQTQSGKPGTIVKCCEKVPHASQTLCPLIHARSFIRIKFPFTYTFARIIYTFALSN
jgi:hypothetical protein